MDRHSGPRILSMRNLFGAVLVAGIATGIYVGKFWKGFGGGSTLGVGVSDGTSLKPGTAKPTETTASKEPDPEPAKPVEVPKVVRVVIDNQSYFLRGEAGDEPIELKQLVELVKAAPGDEDGTRVRIYRRLSSRTSAELALNTALVDAGIKEDQTIWAATPID